MSARVDRRKLNELFKNLKNLQNDLIDKADKGGERVANEVIKPRLKSQMPIITGNLRESTDVEKLKKFEYVTGHDRDKTKTEDGKYSYGDIVYYGSSPHVIVPKRADALRFEVNGQVIYAKKVNHPGTKPNKFVDRTVIDLERNKQQAERVFAEEIKKNEFIN